MGGGDPIPVLTDVLTYHVAGGDIDVFGFILRSFFGIDIETVQGGAMDVCIGIMVKPRFYPLTSRGRWGEVSRILLRQGSAR